MRVDLPVRVMLRCKLVARVELAAGEYPFALLGRNAEGHPELWSRDGKWREDGTPHPFDIVALVAPNGDLAPLTDQFTAI